MFKNDRIPQLFGKIISEKKLNDLCTDEFIVLTLVLFFAR